MERKSSFFVFLIIIAILTLVIAALVSFIMLVGINAATAEGGAAVGGATDVYAFAGEPPDEASLATEVLFESGKPINLMSDNVSKPSYALVEMSVKYFIKIDGIKDVQAKILLNKANLQEIVTTYFMAMSVDEFSRFETKARAKEDLKRELNDFLLTTIAGEKDRRRANVIIYDVVFSAWNYQ